jgi:hypothetical protein
MPGSMPPCNVGFIRYGVCDGATYDMEEVKGSNIYRGVLLGVTFICT